MLSPPLPTIYPNIAKQVADHDKEFWHLWQQRFPMALEAAASLAAAEAAGRAPASGRRRRSGVDDAPGDIGPVRWLTEKVRRQQVASLLRVVTWLDDVMNNTSVVLLIKAGNRRLLFPGDAQLESWQWITAASPKAATNRKNLKKVDLYKVGPPREPERHPEGVPLRALDAHRRDAPTTDVPDVDPRGRLRRERQHVRAERQPAGRAAGRADAAPHHPPGPEDRRPHPRVRRVGRDDGDPGLQPPAGRDPLGRTGRRRRICQRVGWAGTPLDHPHVEASPWTSTASSSGPTIPSTLVAYYTKLLGEPVFSGGGYTSWQIGSGNVTVGLHSEVKGKNTSPGRIIWNIETADVAGEFARMQAAGAIVVTAPYTFEEEPGSSIATFADPDGNYFQLMSPFDPSTMEG